MGGFNVSKREIRGDNLTKRILASLSAVVLVFSMCLAGLIVNPITAQASNTWNIAIDSYGTNICAINGDEDTPPWTIKVTNHFTNMLQCSVTCNGFYYETTSSGSLGAGLSETYTITGVDSSVSSDEREFSIRFANYTTGYSSYVRVEYEGGSSTPTPSASGTKITEEELTSHSLYTGSTALQEIDVPVLLWVDNKTTYENGMVSYVPWVYMKIVAKPVTSGDFLPSTYSTDHPARNGDANWIVGQCTIPFSDTNQLFGSDYNHPMQLSSFGYSNSSFEDKDNGVYRYQIFLYGMTDTEDYKFGNAITIPDMDISGNRVFLDMYVENHQVKAVVLVDEDDHKLNVIGDEGDSGKPDTQVTPSVGGSGGVTYNVYDLIISNTILGKNTANFAYTIDIDTREYWGFNVDNFTMGQQSDTTGTYTGNQRQFRLTYHPSSDLTGFSYVIKNFPFEWTVSTTQVELEDVEGKMQAYVKNAPRWADTTVTPEDWIATTATANSFNRIRNDTHTVNDISTTNNKISYVNAILESTPETGIALQVLPYILMAAGAGVLLLFIMRRRADS